MVWNQQYLEDEELVRDVERELNSGSFAEGTSVTLTCNSGDLIAGTHCVILDHPAKFIMASVRIEGESGNRYLSSSILNVRAPNDFPIR